jgi:hypothetical protein
MKLSSLVLFKTETNLREWLLQNVTQANDGCCYLKNWQSKKRPVYVYYRCGSYHSINLARVVLYLKAPFDESLLACHTCDNELCLNPNHLYAGTHKQNVDDCVNRGRNKYKITWALNIEQRKEVRILYKSGKILQRELAKQFAVSQKTISNIIREVM